MKKMMIIPILISLISPPAYGQDETLISGKIESGGYGGPEVKFSAATALCNLFPFPDSFLNL